MATFSCDSLSTVWCARAALVYVIASVVYLIATRHLGTPFADSLTAAQRQLKAESAAHRGRAFLIGAAVGAAVVYVWRPFTRAAPK